MGQKAIGSNGKPKKQRCFRELQCFRYLGLKRQFFHAFFCFTTVLTVTASLALDTLDVLAQAFQDKA